MTSAVKEVLYSCGASLKEILPEGVDPELVSRVWHLKIFAFTVHAIRNRLRYSLLMVPTQSASIAVKLETRRY